ncbi:MAG: hypothetical protein ABJA78_06035 [Ferruginibacter sp.]
MKKHFYKTMQLGCCILLIGFFSCKKTDKAVDRPKEELIQAKWSINRIQLKFYQGSVLVKDSIVKQDPKPENFATFSGGNVEYRFNSPTSDMGTYTFSGTDSVYASLSANLTGVNTTGKWYNQLLTETNFNVIGRGTSPYYPGGYVDIYQSFVR